MKLRKTIILPPLDAGHGRFRRCNVVGYKDYGKRLICDHCEVARRTAILMTTPTSGQQMHA